MADCNGKDGNIFFLRIKAWELFFLAFVAQFVLMGFSFLVVYITGSLVIGIIINQIIMMLSFLVILRWEWLMGTKINLKISEKIRPKPAFFKFAIIFCAVFTVSFTLFFIMTAFIDIASPELLSKLIMSLLVLDICLMVYSANFVAKNLMMFEKGRSVNLLEYLSTFFMIWFFPIGVWMIQPRVNRIFK